MLHTLAFIPAIGPMELLFVLSIVALVAVAYVLPTWMICAKAGLPPALALLAILPLGIVLVLFILALSEWPALRAQVAADADTLTT